MRIFLSILLLLTALSFLGCSGGKGGGGTNSAPKSETSKFDQKQLDKATLE